MTQLIPDLGPEQLIPLALSVNTLVMMWLAGNKRALGWFLGLVGQGGWVAFILVFEVWGLAPLTVGLIGVYVRNAWRWTHTNQPRPEMDLNALMTRYQPGSGMWSWEDEEAELLEHRCKLHDQPGCYQRGVEHYLYATGVGGLEPVLLGDDRRLHDGHHRVIAARNLGIPCVPVMTYADLKREDVR